MCREVKGRERKESMEKDREGMDRKVMQKEKRKGKLEKRRNGNENRTMRRPEFTR